MSMERKLRPRCVSQYVSQQEWQMEVEEEDDFILARRYNVLEKFRSVNYEDKHGFVKEMSGEDFNLKYIQENGLAHSVVFRDQDSLGLRMPPADFTVADVKKLVGARRKIDVIDTLTQDSVTMSLSQWTKYYETFPRQRLLNVISLEISCTKLDHLVEAPTIVKELDWVEQVWPVELKFQQSNPTNDLNKMMYPKVQKYCLMSVAGCYTDFHLDFGGTSVWYHVLKGEKKFLLIPPSSKNYSLFQKWQMSGEQERVFFAELTDKAQIVHLRAGDTFIMPAGWIHAVYTPFDSIVFGGNFLHSFNISQQLLVAEVERSTKVPPRLKYPFYGTIYWYVLQKYAQELKNLVTTKSESCTDKSYQSSCDSRPWLKGVMVQKCMPIKCDSGSSAVKPMHAKEKNDTEASCKNVLPISSGVLKPHFSNHERGGLLVLVQKMKNKLFELDTPPCVVSSTDLLSELESLLNSTMSESYSSCEPSGIGILKRHHQARLRKRARKNLSDKPLSKYRTTSLSSTERLIENDANNDNDDFVLDCETSSDLVSNLTPSIPLSNNLTSNESVSPSFNEIRLAFDATCSPNTGLTPKEEVYSTNNPNRLDSVGQLLSATSPAPLNIEASIIKLPNPAFINI